MKLSRNYLLWGLVAYWLLNPRQAQAADTGRPYFGLPVSPASMRNDSMGAGHFGASRDGGSRSHNGIDLLVAEGQPVASPIDGVFTRYARPYANDARYDGLLITGTGRYSGYEVKLFYLNPLPALLGQTVAMGDTIGIAQAISRKYGSGMRDHIHLELRHEGVLIDPQTVFQLTA